MSLKFFVLCRAGFFVLFAAAFGAQALAAPDGKPADPRQTSPRLQTNQAFIEDVYRKPNLDIEDDMAVFRFIFFSLPDLVQVYPTENYYYFHFTYKGVPYAGNLRLAANDRHEGKIHFAYFRDYRGWFSEQAGHYRVLNDAAGVEVKQAGPLLYAVRFAGRRVLFQLNDLSHVRPPEGMIRESETYIGPVFDESGVQFFLVYNPTVKLFHYILNEMGVRTDRLIASSFTDHVLIGNRSGFVFYKDRYKDRKILIGIYNGNANINNYFDGPFDQLPDNFLQGDALKNAIIDANPEMAGHIDRYGNFADGENRYMIAPYRHYWLDTDLQGVHDCAKGHKDTEGEDYYACFAAAEEQE